MVKISSDSSFTSLPRCRREFLRAIGMTVGAPAVSFAGMAPLIRLAPAEKTIVVTFGGDARDEETFAPQGQENIPILLNELLLPQGTCFTQVVNQGILGHYVATASIVTGRYEKINNFAAGAPESPTLFEYSRKGLKRPEQDAWVIAPSNGFERLGASEHTAYGVRYGAQVILPKQLLTTAIHQDKGNSLDQMMHLLQDNYEMPAYRPSLSLKDGELHLGQLANALNLSLQNFMQHAEAVDSPDELSFFIARHLFAHTSPSITLLTSTIWTSHMPERIRFT